MNIADIWPHFKMTAWLYADVLVVPFRCEFRKCVVFRWLCILGHSFSSGTSRFFIYSVLFSEAKLVSFCVFLVMAARKAKSIRGLKGIRVNLFFLAKTQFYFVLIAGSIARHPDVMAL